MYEHLKRSHFNIRWVCMHIRQGEKCDIGDKQTGKAILGVGSNLYLMKVQLPCEIRSLKNVKRLPKGSNFFGAQMLVYLPPHNWMVCL